MARGAGEREREREKEREKEILLNIIFLDVHPTLRNYFWGRHHF